jgi:AraC-like DNA-binding protein
MSENGERPCARSSTLPHVFSRFVADAVLRIEAGALNQGSLDALARSLGVAARHLRRAMQAELGASPIELAQSSRLALARRLVEETSLPMTEIAYASGFRSLRRFNALFAAMHGEPPSSVRARSERPGQSGSIALRIEYERPLDWEAMRQQIGARQIAGVERFDRFAYTRTLRVGAKRGWIAVYPRVNHRALIAEISLALLPQAMSIVARLRMLFDLDSAATRRARAYDGFEYAAIAVCGAEAVATLVAKICPRYDLPYAQLTHLPFSAKLIARTGTPKALVPLARAVDAGALSLEPTSDPRRLETQLRELRIEPEAAAEIATVLTQQVTKRRMQWTRKSSVSS